SEQDASFTVTWTSDFASAEGEDAPIVLGDLDGDGLQDLAVIEEGSSQIQIYSGSADGRLQSAQTLAASNAPRFLRTGDVNNDGRLDLFALGDSEFVEVFASIGTAVLPWNFLRQQL